MSSHNIRFRGEAILMSTHNICFRGDSNEYPQRMFLWRTDKKYPSIIFNYPPYPSSEDQETCEFGSSYLTWPGS